MLETDHRTAETRLSARERVLDAAYELFSRDAAQRGKAMARLLIDAHR